MERLSTPTDYCAVECRLESKEVCAYWTGGIDVKCPDAARNDKLREYEDTGLTPEEVAELAQGKADGRCVVLPCKPEERWVGELGEAIVKKIVTDEHGTYIHFRYKGKREIHCCNPRYFSKNFTRAEAEAALREEGNSHEVL